MNFRRVGGLQDGTRWPSCIWRDAIAVASTERVYAEPVAAGPVGVGPIAAERAGAEGGSLRAKAERALEPVLLAFAAGFALLRFVHITADFPNGSRWMDWSKYTDEGWYGDAAIRHFLHGHWYVNGDFNPAVALPVWPLMEAAVFRFTGVSLGAARVLVVAVFCCTLVVLYALVQRYASRRLAAIAVFLIAVSSFGFAFSRLAILEPPLTLLFVLGLLVASRADGRRWWPPIALGVVAPLLVLTKTTGACLLPSVLYLMWAAHGYGVRRFVRSGLLAGAIGAGLWCGYYYGLVRPAYAMDYHYMFREANPTPAFSVHNALEMTWAAFQDGMWVDRVLYPVFLGCVLASLLWMRGLWRNGLWTAMCLAMGGYMSFVIYHSNMQPRYFHITLLPIIVLVVLALGYAAKLGTRWGRATFVVAVAAVVLAALVNVRETIGFAAHPTYTFVSAARRVAEIIRTDNGRLSEEERASEAAASGAGELLPAKAAHSQLLLSISGSDISLITGVRSICDDFGTEDLESKAKRMRPGWYAAWNEADEGTVADIRPHFHLKEVAHFQAFDDPDRDVLILYRMTPKREKTPHSNLDRGD